MTAVEPKISPMMAQWHACKKEAGNAVLFFRLGDFYECFYEDAAICAQELDLTMTKRQTVPMSGMPFHSAEGYIDKLISKGYHVAIAEQMEDPRAVKGIVKREIVRILTPGTVINSTLLQDKANNYISCLTQVGDRYGLAFLDLTCADCRAIELDSLADVISELYRVKPSELLVSNKFQEKHAAFLKEVQANSPCSIDSVEEWRFEHKLACGFLTKLLNVHTLDGFGLKGMVAAINAAGALLCYVQDTLRHDLGPLQAVTPYSHSAFMGLDKTTLRNLELTESLIGNKKNTLLHILDHTQTAMGGRLLKNWIKQPLLKVEEISARQQAIGTLLSAPAVAEKLQTGLSEIRDLERLITRITTGNASPRDISLLHHSLLPIGPIKSCLAKLQDPLLQALDATLVELRSLTDLIDRAVVPEPPFRLSDGGVFREGYNAELDELKNLAKDSKTWMAEYQNQIREQTGIKTLRVGYTNVSGFYIEVSKGQAEKVPDIFQRRQTLTNAERYITPELKIFEEKILKAEDRISQIETALFFALREQIAAFAKEILINAKALSVIDCLLSLSTAARQNRYVKPIVDASNVLEIVEGRHPVIEAAAINEKFIPNDTYLDNDLNRLFLITGPNMAGKSTYIRQVALIAIMAQIGSFVPATKAHIGIIDKVFTRIGASDDLSRGQSTFMVEMTETANILHNATQRSLVILDEIGRGTSTYDGISLAWSIAEYLLTTPEKMAKTLFATHYWELTKLEEKVPGAVNYNVAVHESGDQIVFLRKIVKGGTDKSYGIHVAKLAGLPQEVLHRAHEILQHLEENSNQKSAFETPRAKRVTPQRPKHSPLSVQLSLIPDAL